MCRKTIYDRSWSIVLFCLLAVPLLLPAQASNIQESRYALVIGNSEYEGIPSLKNPVNDASDMKAALERLGFTVELLTNASQSQMETAVVRLGGRLGSSKQAVGLFYYAGHGIQASTGVNYLIPSRVSIPSEDFLSEKAVSTQAVLNTLNRAGNTLNLVILDACRDNPYGWARSGTRGLAVVGQQPAGSIVMYATSANSVAQDGTGRNGVFTGELLRQLETAGLEIGEVVRRTGAAVQQVTGGKQVPAVSNQFFQTFYLKPATTGGAQPTPSVQAPAPNFGAVTVATGSLSITVASAATVSLLGQSVQLPAGGTLPVNNVEMGYVTVNVRFSDGKTESRSVRVEANRTTSMAFDYRTTPPTQTALSAQPAKPVDGQQAIYKVGDRGPAGGIIFYDKGNSSGGWRYLEVAPIDTHAGIQWYNGKFIDIKGTDVGIGTGKENTAAIIVAQGSGSYAAMVCRSLSLGGFSDWFLPSKDELDLMYRNLKKQNLGGFSTNWYWSSSQYNDPYNSFAWYQWFSSGDQDYGFKQVSIGAVRAVRAFNN
jgi:hypothetical protein